MIPAEITTSLHFNAVARVLHWLMAIMVLAMLFLGAGMMTSLTHRPWMINLHRPLGIAILLLVIVRLFNRLRHSPPPLPATLPNWQKLGAHISHVALYGLMLALPLIGWATLSAAGYPITMFAGLALPPIVPVSAVWYGFLRDAHTVLAWLLFATVLAHLAAALMHGWIHRDGVFGSMAKGDPGSERQSIQPNNEDLGSTPEILIIAISHPSHLELK